ncbi:MAG TPA: choline dehydrogenase [Methylomirabilota bacterium]|nr:choline dehydrogenase [Methylomirabilota bacterium]
MDGIATFDYIIVGAGSAGCVLANRLGAKPEHRILVLEAGGQDRFWNWKIHMPAAFAYPLADDKVNWHYHSEPEPYMDGRKMYCPRGRVIGGSSSINGMVYIRGHARDYDRWAQLGLKGWSYADILPYFRKAEDHEQGADDYHGIGGPLHVSHGRTPNPLFEAWVEAGKQAGYPMTPDLNGYQQEGLGPMEMTTRRGRRWSAAKAYLRPALARGNVTVQSRALTLRILFEGRRAVGIEYAQRGQVQQARATREVIVCGGAINSPQLLMLSGVGPADHLRGHKIDVVQDLPGVGANLQDHIETYVQHRCTQPITLYPVLKSPLRQLLVGIEWTFLGTGVGATNHFEAGGFIRSEAGVEHPDLQYHFLPIAASYDGSATQPGHGFQAHVGPMRPTSRGTVRLKSADPRQAPEIRFNYMQTDQDRREFRAGIKLTREIFAQAAFDPYRGPELAPGPEVKTDAEIDAHLRRKAESAYHPSCTCKMGLVTDPLAVVDDAGRVHGLESLRVVDASIMPNVVSGNLNAPTIMMAERLADSILGQPLLPRSDAKVYIAPDYETRQR